MSIPPLALFPVYLFDHDFEPPKTGTYYLVTKTGIYLHKETKAGNALVKVDGIPWLKEPTIEFRLKLPKIPGSIIGQALTFFRKVFEEHRSESYVTLLYSSTLNQYRLWCPKQTVSYASVNYDRTDQPSFEDRTANDWQMCGTIHSHCDFSAYHSGTDVGDEATFDGIHITLGHVNRNQFSMEASVAINNTREKLEPENCCSGVIRISNKEVTSRPYMTWGDSCFFDLELTDDEAQQLVADTEVITNEWMQKVEHTKSYFTGNKIGFHVGRDYRGEWDGVPRGHGKKNDQDDEDNEFFELYS